MSAQHTAGPWVFDAESHDVQHDESSMVIARVTSPDDFPCRDQEQDEAFAAECRANGHALAAGPDAIAALRLALEYWAHRQQRYKNRHPAWVQAARAAVAKAEGRS